MSIVFDACVNFLLWLGPLVGMTYVEINVWIFCIIWPIFTIVLMVIIYVLLRRISNLAPLPSGDPK